MTKLNLKLNILLLLFLTLISSCTKTKIETEDNFDVVEFPDGSVAFLNHNSSVEYDKDFSSRNIKLDGEAFFSVTKDETPFTITTDFAEITVLGTEFNVKSEKEEIDVEVEHGMVMVKTAESENEIGSGKRANYRKGNSEIKIGKAKLKFKIWLKDLKIEWKKLEKEIHIDSKQLDKEFKKASKGIEKEIKRLKFK